MKRVTEILCVIFVLALGLSAQGATIVYLTFDSATGTNFVNYTLDPADIPTTATIHFHKPYVGSERDYGLMPPQPGVDTGNYPDIVTPAVPGWQGGNAFWTCAGNIGDSQQHIGWYITDSAIPTVTGDFTGEAIFMLAKIGTPGDIVYDSEYSLHNVFGTQMLAGNPGSGWKPNDGADWKFRVWPDGIIGGHAQLQLNMGGTDGGGEVNVDGPDMVINWWYHVACVYTAATDTAELFLDGVSQGSASPNWANSGQDNWWVGAWPSNGANRGLAGWIDAIALSDEVLAPANFVLPRTYTYTKAAGEWALYY